MLLLLLLTTAGNSLLRRFSGKARSIHNKELNLFVSYIPAIFRMDISAILSLVNHICSDEQDDSKYRSELCLEQELIDDGREGLLWACDDLLTHWNQDLPASGSGVCGSFAVSLENEYSVFKRSDVLPKQIVDIQRLFKTILEPVPSRTSVDTHSKVEKSTLLLSQALQETQLQKRSAASVSHSTKRQCVGDDETDEKPSLGGFVSAKSQYIIDQQKKFGKSYNLNNDK